MTEDLCIIFLGGQVQIDKTYSLIDSRFSARNGLLSRSAMESLAAPRHDPLADTGGKLFGGIFGQSYGCNRLAVGDPKLPRTQAQGTDCHHRR
ncbi:MAG: hypothetical protein Q7K57_58530, partial [Burkholderiaceae bacterium]|nr:hypothetical protein [Burkholderiaceae bacterium]